ncbi:hypothetical protein COW09_00570 [bacterium (Candidatus Moisslbacteria) CG12_big_fil_rev_8_21_14_0_65_36_11]|nr:HU family DNA-binding protein [Candidatus Kuenenbacteria bacterium]OIP76290.1 MAG: hypothetical protein AUK09_02370 [Parcubacteria group bacterium CG2_30_36_38]PIV46147.1 MAG: hypothetical protein COS23_00605 [bacterium (Candidatus Moisslbacteria) CG02_land_8_20_14_3_00_36_53]PIW68027.1 MAG: hypothetical protein COW09_00570 [bacterium (Candidatus Moisslbacteria) CG12_big_fil_rev_8_21_14_0_65_36_11]PIZ90484.1 MAG: hypothetical protein COX87_00180 [bacterium (Candidatus Moisslbacteria) CG_4_10
MNKKELVEKLADELKEEIKTKAEAGRIVDKLLEIVINNLKKGEKVNIAGFCVLQVKLRKARMGINPKTQEKIQIPAKKAVKFRALKELKQAVL